MSGRDEENARRPVPPRARRERRYLLFASKPNYLGVLRPLQAAIEARGEEARWFVTADVPAALLRTVERTLPDVRAVKDFAPHAVLVPGNWVPDFFPGIKVQVFHDVGFTKKGRFRNRGLFDLYCTCGPRVTAEFEALAARHRHCRVIETGWPKLDPLFRFAETITAHDAMQVLYAPTFSPSLSSAEALHTEIARLRADPHYQWTVKFHDKMDPDTIARYESLQGPGLRVVRDPDIIPLLHGADVLVSDTSSVIVEFLLLDKPVIAYRNSDPGPHLTGIDEAGELAHALARVRADPGAAREPARRYAAANHPYRDGRSSERVLQAVETFIAERATLRPKPLNLWRKLRMRRRLRYFGWR